MMKRLSIVGVVAAAACALTACSASIGGPAAAPPSTDTPVSTSPSQTQPSASVPADLQGSWTLTWWIDEAGALPDVEITLNITADGVAGKSACNNYLGPLTADASGGFRIGLLAGTLMACVGPAEDAETTYRGLLDAATSWQRTGDTLTLSTEGIESLKFELAK
ncbi:MAG: META domain-containing protein [Propionibacteriaceae bacterium]|nr:META domain-containing protein [Propionibacteriaceae bacterium]